MAIKGASKGKGFFDDLEVTIIDEQTGFKKTLKSFNQITSFIEEERNFWGNLYEKYSLESSTIADFIKFLDEIQLKLNRVSDLAAAKSIKDAQDDVDRISEILNTEGHNVPSTPRKITSHHYIFSTTDEAALVADLGAKLPIAVDGAFAYFDGRGSEGQNRLTILGYLQACALDTKKHQLGDPADHQKVSFEHIRNEIETSQQKFEQWSITVEGKSDEQFNAAQNRMEGLEKTYSDKLKLEEPAKYWETRAKKLRQIGYGWAIGLILASIMMISTLANILLQEKVPLLGSLFSENGVIHVDSF